MGGGIGPGNGACHDGGGNEGGIIPGGGCW